MLGGVMRCLAQHSKAPLCSPSVTLVGTSVLKHQARSIQAAADIFTRKKMGTTGYFMMAIPGVAFCLGCWQVQRRQWKLQLIKDLEDKIALPPVELPTELSELADMDYRRVLLRGTFDHSKELLMGPRPALHAGRYRETGSMLSRGGSGFLIVTPFTLADTGVTVLVNRGWVPKSRMYPGTRQDGQVTGVQELMGVVRLQENRGPFMPKNIDRNKFFIYRDIATMSIVTGTSPVFLDACDGVAAGPMAGQTRVTLRNEHLSYLLTWYSLSFITGFLWYRRYINPRAFI